MPSMWVEEAPPGEVRAEVFHASHISDEGLMRTIRRVIRGNALCMGVTVSADDEVTMHTTQTEDGFVTRAVLKKKETT